MAGLARRDEVRLGDPSFGKAKQVGLLKLVFKGKKGGIKAEIGIAR